MAQRATYAPEKPLPFRTEFAVAPGNSLTDIGGLRKRMKFVNSKTGDSLWENVAASVAAAAQSEVSLFPQAGERRQILYRAAGRR